MDKKTAIIVLGTAHRLREPGKCSPDGRVKECIWSREIVAEIADKLKEYGYKVIIDMPEMDLPKTMQTPSVKLERNRELGMRVNIVNELCRQNGAKNVLYVSVHINAAGADGKWHSANGWQVCVGSKASEKSKLLAECLFDAAKAQGIKLRQPSPQQKYWPQSLYVCNSTNCPAVLTENMFQDNMGDVDYLMSDLGKHQIARLHIEGIINYIEKVG